MNSNKCSDFSDNFSIEWRNDIIIKMLNDQFYNTPKNKWEIKKWFKKNEGSSKVDVTWNDNNCIVSGFFGYIYLKYNDNKLKQITQ